MGERSNSAQSGPLIITGKEKGGLYAPHPSLLFPGLSPGLYRPALYTRLAPRGRTGSVGWCTQGCTGWYTLGRYTLVYTRRDTPWYTHPVYTLWYTSLCTPCGIPFYVHPVVYPPWDIHLSHPGIPTLGYTPVTPGYTPLRIVLSSSPKGYTPLRTVLSFSPGLRRGNEAQSGVCSSCSRRDNEARSIRILWEEKE